MEINIKSSKRCKKIVWAIIQIVKGLFLLFVIIFFLGFPFILDRLYKDGMLGRIWDNAFSADVWFSFIGSYFPATIIGIITLYQAHIIQVQEKQYKKLMNRHRFIPAKHAKIYRYEEENNSIGDYSIQKIKQMLMRSGRKGLLKEWQSGFIIECNVYNSSGIEINRADLKMIEWEIAGVVYRQTDMEKASSIVNRISYSQQQIIVFWCFDKEDDVSDQVIQCMLYSSRRDIRYETSMITVVLHVVDDADESFDLQMRFRMQYQEDNYKMASIEENYYVV